MATPHALILRAPGTNCDQETAYAFQLAGATTACLHINQLREQPKLLRTAQILVLPGGFSYGDDVGAGSIWGAQLRHFLADAVREFRGREKLILGICNGFQALLKAGLLLPPDEDGPLATLAPNVSRRYTDRWVQLQVTAKDNPFLKGIDTLDLPIAHGEGNFTCRKEWILQGLEQSGQVVLRFSTPSNAAANYVANPNGSQGDIAGICDATGRVFGLMPHPERHLLPTQHPQWTRRGLQEHGDGFAIFKNAVEHFKQ
jgi:phosphoribosylformylglycinamidine synthase subunit PurQ / glutaminase